MSSEWARVKALQSDCLGPISPPLLSLSVTLGKWLRNNVNLSTLWLVIESDIHTAQIYIKQI